MKIITLLSLLITSYAYGQSSFSATSPISVATGFGNYHTQIEISNDDRALVLWTNPADYNLYFARHDGAGSFNPPIQLNPGTLDVQSYNWSGPDLAVEGDNVYVVFRSLGYETGHIYLVKSSDNGISFSDTTRIDDLSTGFGQYPDVAVFQDTIWVTFMDHETGGANPQYVVARSTDGGITFSSEVLAGALTSAEACDCCQPEIIVDDERVIVFFRNNDANIRDIKGVISYDRGQTFTEWISVDDHNWLISACPSTGPDARFINGDTSLTIYKTSVSGQAMVFINEFDLNAGTSNGIVQITAEGTSNSQINYPQIAVENETIGIVWEAAGSGMDVYINSSTTGIFGLNPLYAYNVSDISGTQNKPDIAISNGIFHVVYADYNDSDIKYVQLGSNAVIDENIEEFTFDVYPNPAEDYINVSVSNETDIDLTLSLISIDGKMMFTENFKSINSSSLIQLDVGDFESGIYFLKINTGNRREVIRIVL